MARPVANEHDTATPERLLEAALNEFAASGFSAARLEDIARRAGIRRPSLLYHYPSKEALYVAVIDHVFAQLRTELLAAATRVGPWGERVENTVLSLESFFARHPTFAHLVMRELLDRRGPGPELLLGEVVPLLEQLESLVTREGGVRVREDIPLRSVLLQLAAGITLRAVAGPLGPMLWGPDSHTAALARALFTEVRP